ncbi:hypothetical protein ACMXYY_05710 [Acinetobacter courvalinii]|uniref:hypothetical protein n=1 Tax=Acinetobacter courvalinii TaxID=280147 RepID=UPI002896C5BE|nr:hypothetical protein [Acinetobacter courvalinii]
MTKNNKKYLTLFLCLFISACDPYMAGDDEIVQHIHLDKLTASQISGMSGDLFTFNMGAERSLRHFYVQGNYKYSHFSCMPIQDYVVIGSVSIDEEHVEHGMYISSGSFKVCEDESMNTCLRKTQIEGLLTDNLSCRLVVGGLFKKSKVIADAIVITRDSILESKNL